ncbi:MAG: hypothetical protein ACO3QC_10725, partial [Phycisphaerales bacterium]
MDRRRKDDASTAGKKPRLKSGRGHGLPAGPLGSTEGGDRATQVAAEIRRGLQSELSRGVNDPRGPGRVSRPAGAGTPAFAAARGRGAVMP